MCGKVCVLLHCVVERFDAWHAHLCARADEWFRAIESAIVQCGGSAMDNSQYDARYRIRNNSQATASNTAGVCAHVVWWAIRCAVFCGGRPTRRMLVTHRDTHLHTHHALRTATPHFPGAGTGALTFAAVWTPDNEAKQCMYCQTQFTVIKRRHHCRACGKVVCGACSSNKIRLEHLDRNKFVRVCDMCHLASKANVAYGTRFYMQQPEVRCMACGRAFPVVPSYACARC